MNRPGLFALQIGLLAAPVGCMTSIDSSEGEEHTAEAASQIVAQNALLPNALIPNALIPNALIPNALVPNALDPDALDPSALATIQDPGPGGELSRSFIRYAVGCALRPDQSFSFSWTDDQGVTHQETYYGALGIAHGWAAHRLSPTDQTMVSACMAARTNYFGTPVTISIRSHQGPLHATGKPELTEYHYIEGAFWGNIFTSDPHLSACYTTADVNHSRSASRDCAAGHVDSDGETSTCGIINIVGACEAYCKKLDCSGQYYPECTDPLSGKTDKIATTALP